jgi:predicted NAD/FAD-binding protein
VSRLSERELPATRRHGRFRDATRSRSTSASLGRAGHSHTVTTDYQGTPIAVNIGFIVHNELNYPDLTALFDHLGVETIESCMSFAVTADAGRFEWRGGGRGNWLETGKGLFAQRSNLASPSYLWMLCDILTFDNQSVADHAAGKLAGLTLGDYFRRNHFAPRLLTDYLAPMGAAIWSAPASEILDFPAENFVAFFSNHRLLQYDRPVWRTVKGGSQHYVEKLTAAFKDRLRLGCAATSIERTPTASSSTDSDGRSETYDHVVIASHSDQALAMLSDADNRERAILGAIGYAPNTVYLHRDIRLMPRRKRA